MIAGEANHLELFFLSHRYGKPKNLDEVPERPPIMRATKGISARLMGPSAGGCGVADDGLVGRSIQ